ncbi:glycoside hydrolase family 31 protein [Changchengzhania lutea]|uniref:glycoside hydrolase family 31 protein n=1 Tax=Changchengzhania lutea TaxID=2049305 RepID=UPI00115E80C6|nr:TIM-barrel domain-containing protein [Changchengzhania lutea]
MKALLNQVIDVSSAFTEMENEFFLPKKVIDFDSEKCTGKLQWEKHCLRLDWAFNKIGLKLEKQGGKEWPQEDYDVNPSFQWDLSFITERTIRLRMSSDHGKIPKEKSKMLLDKPLSNCNWICKDVDDKIIYKSNFGKIKISKSNWKVAIFDNNDELLFETLNLNDNKSLHQKYTPFSFVRKSKDYSRGFAASFSLSPNEKIYGCGESFTRLDKRGQKIQLFATDAQSTATKEMYKPIPFFMSSKGYGMFVHSTTPMTFDFGNTYDACNTLFIGDEFLDVFIFIGNPKEILSEYTNITGKSPVPPIWTFGLWMSRLSYQSQTEVLDVAKKMRNNKIPCDVIHIDAGWFKNGLNCDFEFGTNYETPKSMISQLKEKGFYTSLWQLPYYTTKNPLYTEIIEKKLYIQNGNHNVPTSDVILDFTNPKAQQWYAEKVDKLLDIGVSAIKADFGESAPLKGVYHSNRNGFYEHNLYPLYYTRFLYELVKKKSSENIIWARSTWAGGQRYPIHWGGDSEVSDFAMATSLRAGMSLGLSGFTYWSHDIGGFSSEPNEELFLRWAFFGIFSSHSRVHGMPPREPWLFNDEFMNTFRSIVELKYKLLPYIYMQAVISSEKGIPMLRPLFFEFPKDLTSWYIEDQYLFGDSILIAPFIEANKNKRNVYIPQGDWVDYQTGNVYNGSNWWSISSEKLPGIILVKSGTILPHVKLAQCTRNIDWSEIILTNYATEENASILFISTPLNKKAIKIDMQKDINKTWEITCKDDSINFIQENYMDRINNY